MRAAKKIFIEDAEPPAHGIATRSLPPEGKVARYFLGYAQNNTPLHQELWQNMQALARHYDAEMLISRGTYKVGAADSYVRIEDQKHAPADLWYPAAAMDNDGTADIWLTPDLLWAGRVNTLPTRVNPLTGLEAYAQHGSAIFAHPKIALKSLPRMKGEQPRMLTTTGSITMKNYVQRTAGQKAELDHVYGFAIAEVDSEGDWWIRQVSAQSSGTIRDLDLIVQQGMVRKAPRLGALVMGDVHHATLNADAWNATMQVIQELCPQNLVVHDALDFRSRNHHDRAHAKMYKKWVDNMDCVRTEIENVAKFLTVLGSLQTRPTKIVMVDSNHDRALSRWLDEADFRLDQVNAEIFLELSMRRLRRLKAGDDWNALREALRNHELPASTVWVSSEKSHTIYGVEMALHGDLGANGSRGSIAGMNKLGRRSCIGHSHSPGIQGGVYQAGMLGELDQGYNAGPTSWAHAHVVLYKNGKRTLLIMRGGRFYAPRDDLDKPKGD